MHSVVTKKGQTTIPSEVREALNIKPGDRIEYRLEAGQAVIRVHPGTGHLKGALKSDLGRELSFAEIRATVAQRRRKAQQ